MGTRREHGRDERDLDHLVDEILGAPGGGAAADDDEREVAQRLRALADEPLPASTRERHLARLRQTPPSGSTAARRAPWRRGRVPRRVVPVLAAVLTLLLIGGGGAVAAAQDATPDDALYGLKRASEDVWVAVPRGGERAAQVHLHLAARRHGEAARAPDHAQMLLAATAEHVDSAAEDLPEEAFETLKRLLGDTDERLPDEASPMARAALHRNCMRLAERHGFAAGECPDPGVGPDDHPGMRGLDRGHGQGPRGWGPDGRPAGETGPPEGVPGHERDRGPAGVDRERPGWGPDGRPDGHEGPPPWSRGEGDDDPDTDDGGADGAGTDDADG